MKPMEIALLALMVGAVLVGSCGLGRRAEPSSNQPAVSLPTLVPTPAIIVPTPPAGSVTFNGNGNSYTYEINVTQVDTCAAVIGCWQR